MIVTPRTATKTSLAGNSFHGDCVQMTCIFQTSWRVLYLKAAFSTCSCDHKLLIQKQLAFLARNTVLPLGLGRLSISCKNPTGDQLLDVWHTSDLKRFAVWHCVGAVRSLWTQQKQTWIVARETRPSFLTGSKDTKGWPSVGVSCVPSITWDHPLKAENMLMCCPWLQWPTPLPIVFK